MSTVGKSHRVVSAGCLICMKVLSFTMNDTFPLKTKHTGSAPGQVVCSVSITMSVQYVCSAPRVT